LAWGEAGHVVALKLDRLFRDAEDCLHQTKVWDKAGVGLHLVDLGGQSLNTKSAMGRLFLTMAAAFAELERNLTSERTVQALAHKKANGAAYGPTPFGFRREGDRLFPDPAELDTVRQIHEWHQAGWSLRQIAGELNGRNGKRWYASTVRYLLRNDLYAEVI
jgi:DNA invertase Pin-like site-specific DNA recombinase